DYLKPFYRGGLNFYNQFFIGKIIDNVFGMDIHSSYPYAMHNFKIPTYIKDYEEHEKPKEVNINYTDDEYSLFQISKENFDHMIIEKHLIMNYDKKWKKWLEIENIVYKLKKKQVVNK